ncbi:DUF4148 domain-containing protein [Paraburkholderia megapolitana]|uniref:DUF4148 domain-containing protein n=1 Tax=Paraburkholderia megapolitana TaxID=420953 RepID=UPI0038BB7CAD
MKTVTINLIAAVVMALPIASHAQGPDTVTRAQVRAELVQLENAGYRPRANDPHYPDDIQAAEAKIAANDANASVSTNSVGGSPAGSSASGNRANAVEMFGSVYARH